MTAAPFTAEERRWLAAVLEDLNHPSINWDVPHAFAAADAALAREAPQAAASESDVHLDGQVKCRHGWFFWGACEDCVREYKAAREAAAASSSAPPAGEDVERELCRLLDCGHHYGCSPEPEEHAVHCLARARAAALPLVRRLAAANAELRAERDRALAELAAAREKLEEATERVRNLEIDRDQLHKQLSRI